MAEFAVSARIGRTLGPSGVAGRSVQNPSASDDLEDMLAAIERAAHDLSSAKLDPTLDPTRLGKSPDPTSRLVFELARELQADGMDMWARLPATNDTIPVFRPHSQPSAATAVSQDSSNPAVHAGEEDTLPTEIIALRDDTRTEAIYRTFEALKGQYADPLDAMDAAVLDHFARRLQTEIVDTPAVTDELRDTQASLLAATQHLLPDIPLGFTPSDVATEVRDLIAADAGASSVRSANIDSLVTLLKVRPEFLEEFGSVKDYYTRRLRTERIKDAALTSLRVGSLAMGVIAISGATFGHAIPFLVTSAAVGVASGATGGVRDWTKGKRIARALAIAKDLETLSSDEGTARAAIRTKKLKREQLHNRIALGVDGFAIVSGAASGACAGIEIAHALNAFGHSSHHGTGSTAASAAETAVDSLTTVENIYTGVEGTEMGAEAVSHLAH